MQKLLGKKLQAFAGTEEMAKDFYVGSMLILDSFAVVAFMIISMNTFTSTYCFILHTCMFQPLLLL